MHRSAPFANTVWFHWSDDRTADVNAVIAIVLGAVAAGLVSVDRALPFLAGLAQAVITIRRRILEAVPAGDG